jgi:hypothetical protein
MHEHLGLLVARPPCQIARHGGDTTRITRTETTILRIPDDDPLADGRIKPVEVVARRPS